MNPCPKCSFPMNKLYGSDTIYGCPNCGYSNNKEEKVPEGSAFLLETDEDIDAFFKAIGNFKEGEPPPKKWWEK